MHVVISEYDKKETERTHQTLNDGQLNIFNLSHKANEPE